MPFFVNTKCIFTGADRLDGTRLYSIITSPNKYVRNHGLKWYYSCTTILANFILLLEYCIRRSRGQARPGFDTRLHAVTHGRPRGVLADGSRSLSYPRPHPRTGRGYSMDGIIIKLRTLSYLRNRPIPGRPASSGTKIFVRRMYSFCRREFLVPELAGSSGTTACQVGIKRSTPHYGSYLLLYTLYLTLIVILLTCIWSTVLRPSPDHDFKTSMNTHTHLF